MEILRDLRAFHFTCLRVFLLQVESTPAPQPEGLVRERKPLARSLILEGFYEGSNIQ